MPPVPRSAGSGDAASPPRGAPAPPARAPRALRCPLSAALPAHPRPGRRRRSRCARSPRPPARSRPGAADASTWLMGESAPRQGAESGGGLSSAAPPPRVSPRACPASAAGPASAIPLLGLSLHRLGRSCSPVYSCPVRLSSEGRSSASRSQIHSGKRHPGHRGQRSAGPCCACARGDRGCPRPCRCLRCSVRCCSVRHGISRDRNSRASGSP